MFSHKIIAILVLVVVLAVGGSIYFYVQKHPPIEVKIVPTYKTAEEADAYVRFVMEAYDLIQKNYWQKISDADLSQHFELSIQKSAATTTTSATKDRAGIAKFLMAVIRSADDAKRKDIATQTVQVAVYNLQPIGRAELLSQQSKTDLTNTVTNVNPGNDLYKTLGLPAGASTSSIDEAYKKKAAELAATTSPDKEKVIADAKYAKEVLSDRDHKALYDQAKIEPTVFARKMGMHTLYVYVEKMSPTTESEFEKALNESAADASLTGFIMDLRGNIGGDLAFAQTFLGLFLGPNQYAYDIFHAGAYDAQRTIGLQKLASLLRFREIAVLTDNMTQSTAEIITAALKRDHRAVVVGDTTRGWGSIEQIVQMQTPLGSETYSLLLVVGLTVADDAQQIEGRGVIPDVNVKNNAWQSELSKHLFSSDLITVLKKTALEKPLK